MRVLRDAPASPSESLALEEALQLGLEDGSSPPTWRVWQAASHAVVIGTGQEAAKEVDLAAARADGVPVLRRHSGGGAVLIGPGAINYSGFFRIDDLPGAHTISGAMEAALQPVLIALEHLAKSTPHSAIHYPQFHLAGLSDIAVSQSAICNPQSAIRKIAGHAQARKRVSVLVHGTLLADPDWARIERYLPFPSRPPEYRGGRAHREFLTSLKDLGLPITLDAFAAALGSAAGCNTPSAVLPSETERARAAELLAKKYSREDWNLRR